MCQNILFLFILEAQKSVDIFMCLWFINAIATKLVSHVTPSNLKWPKLRKYRLKLQFKWLRYACRSKNNIEYCEQENGIRSNESATRTATLIRRSHVLHRIAAKSEKSCSMSTDRKTKGNNNNMRNAHSILRMSTWNSQSRNPRWQLKKRRKKKTPRKIQW